VNKEIDMEIGLADAAKLGGIGIAFYLALLGTFRWALGLHIGRLRDAIGNVGDSVNSMANQIREIWENVNTISDRGHEVSERVAALEATCKARAAAEKSA